MVVAMHVYQEETLVTLRYLVEQAAKHPIIF